MPIIERSRMDKHVNEFADDGQPKREDGVSASIEDAGMLMPSADGDVPDVGSLSGVTIGNHLFGERLGGGAMASVYRAHDNTLDREVAIKVLLPGADPVMQARFRREARLVSTLVHPHIVRTLQVGRSGGIIYIAMELIEGASLGDLLERYGKLSVADAASILAPIADALAYAHEKGIIHRDVKPSNILLQRTTTGAANSVVTRLLPYPVIPLLSDFGIARALDAPELTNAGRTIGTPAFMAPEQCAGSADIDGRADVYALGAVLYRCLVGRPPFAGSTTQILHAHVYDPLLIPDEIADSLPPHAMGIMARAMMKEPSQRFANVQMMAAALRDVADAPVGPSVATSVDIVDSTMTMASLPVAQSSSTQTSRILVAAPPAAPSTGVSPKSGTQRNNLLKSVPRIPSPATTPPRSVQATPLNHTRFRSRRSRWGVMALGGAFVVLVLLLAVTLVNSFVPGVGVDEPGSGNMPPAVGVSATSEVPAVGLDATVTQIPTAMNSSGVRETPVQSGRQTPVSRPVGPTPMPTDVPPLDVPLDFAWELALSFYDEGDWDAALMWLIAAKRALNGAQPPMLRELEVNARRVDEMIVESYIGLATIAVKEGKWDKAIKDLDDALEIFPDDATVGELRKAIAGLAELAGSTSNTVENERKVLREMLVETLATFSDRLVRAGRVCDALHPVNSAITISVSEELQERQAELVKDCDSLKASGAIAEVGGTILYSSEDGSYNIYRLAIPRDDSNPSQSELVVVGGAQPRLNSNGSMLAYYSRQAGNDGLRGVTMGANFTVLGAPQQYSPNPEDSRDSPPSWNRSSTQLAYSTKFDNGPSRVYVTSADTNLSVADLKDGKDPAWHPFEDMIVFNGLTLAGQSPGLYLMSADGDGVDRRALTDNGNDQRPTWSPDGKYIVFMSKDRNGDNWELYRYEMATSRITLLTDADPAKDGLPAISPDGKWVAFMSDRGGRWKLWYVSIDGGPVYFLSDIRGQPVAWLEHAIQWVE